ncbi:MAG: alpha/beta fold hydrolase [Bacteroidia bacterium]
MKKIVLLLFTIALSSFLFSQNTVEGSWLGTLDIQGVKLRLVFNVEQRDGQLFSTMDSPDQGAKDIPVDKTIFNNDSIRFEIPGALIVYKGKLVSENKIEGQFKQGAYKTSLDLERTEEVPTLNRPQEPKPPYPYASEEVTFKNTSANITLAGTLTKPEGEGPFACVVMITGSGPQNRDEEIMGHKPFLVIADHLTRNGIAVLRYDDRGTYQSTGDFSYATTRNLADDVNSAVAYLQTRSDIKQIGLIGHSEGGVIAPMVAAENKNVDFIVMLAGTGVNGAEILLLQQELIGRAEGFKEKDLIKNKEANMKIYDIILSSKDENDAKTKLEKHLKNKKNLPVNSSGISEKLFVKNIIDTYTNGWMFYFMRLEPSTALEKVSCPVLALNGSKDLQVDAGQNLPPIKTALEKAGNKDITIKEYPNLNHLFQECETGAISEYVKIEQTFSPQVLEDMTNWILKRVE